MSMAGGGETLDPFRSAGRPRPPRGRVARPGEPRRLDMRHPECRPGLVQSVELLGYRYGNREMVPARPQVLPDGDDGTPTPRRSAMVATASSSLRWAHHGPAWSPGPPARPGRAPPGSTAYPAKGQTARCRRATVSMLSFSTSGPASKSCPATPHRLGSPSQDLHGGLGVRDLIVLMVCAMAPAPPQEIVTGHAGDHRVPEPHPLHRFGHPLRFIR